MHKYFTAKYIPCAVCTVPFIRTSSRSKYCGECRIIVSRSSNRPDPLRRRKAVFNSLRRKALRKGLKFDLAFDDIKIPERCPALDCELIPQEKQASFNSPSIDRIDPTKGYTKDNVQILSRKANAMKSNASRKELRKFAEWVLRTYPL